MLGFIFQSFHLIGTLDAVENVALPLSFRGVKRSVRNEKADQMLDLVKLGKHKKQSSESDVGRTAAKGRRSKSACYGTGYYLC